MPSSDASTPTYMMFFRSWRSFGSANLPAAIAVSGTPIAWTSGRKRDGGIGFVLS